MQQQVAFDDDVCDVLVDQNAELDLYSAHNQEAHIFIKNGPTFFFAFFCNLTYFP
jgi:hypothetical protein